MRARAVGLLAVLLLSCSLGVPQPDACQSSSECRAAFGAGTYCDLEGGRCESVITDLCPELFPADVANDPDAILFGTILDRDSENQRVRERAMQLAVSGIDDRNGIDGRRVGLLHCDSDSATDASAHLVDRVGVTAILGPSSSRDTEAVFTSHRDDEVLVVSPSATAQQLTTLDAAGAGQGLLWRTAPPDGLQRQVLLAELGAVRASIVARQTDTYAQSLSVDIQTEAASSALDIVEAVQFGDPDQIAAAAMSALGAGAPPDVVIFISSAVGDAARFLEAVGANGAYDGVQLFLTDAAANEELLTLTAGGPGESRYPLVRATRPSTPDTIITSEFVAAYRSANDGVDPLQFSFTAQAYDAMALVILGTGYALREGGEPSGPRIAEGLGRLTSGATAQLLAANFGSIISSLRTGTTVNVVGASGELDFDAASDELLSATYDVLTIEGTGADARYVVARSVTVP